MINKSFKLLIVVTITLIGLSEIVHGQDNEGKMQIPKESQSDNYITGLSVTDVGSQVLPGFEIKDSRGSIMSLGRLIRFSNPSSGGWLEITMSAYPSLKQAEDNIHNYFKFISSGAIPGTKSGMSIGDKVWHYTSSNAITFMRKNVIVNIGGRYPTDFAEVAKKIDDMLLYGGKGIVLSKQPPAPFVQFQGIPSIIHKGDLVPIAINPIDTTRKTIHYNFVLEKNNLGTLIRGTTDNECSYKAEKAGTNSIMMRSYTDDNIFTFEEKTINTVE